MSIEVSVINSFHMLFRNIMKHRIPSSRWELMMIISSIFLTLNTVVFGGEKKKVYLKHSLNNA